MYEDEGLDAFMEDQISGHQFGDDVSEFADEPEMPDDPGDGMTDVEADAQTLAMCGWGTDEDYGYFGGECDDWGE